MAPPRSKRSGAATFIDFMLKVLQYAGRSGFYAYLTEVCGPTFVVLVQGLLDALAVLNENDDWFAKVDSTAGEPWDAGGVPALLQMPGETPLKAAQRFIEAAAMKRGYNQWSTALITRTGSASSTVRPDATTPTPSAEQD